MKMKNKYKSVQEKPLWSWLIRWHIDNIVLSISVYLTLIAVATWLEFSGYSNAPMFFVIFAAMLYTFIPAERYISLVDELNSPSMWVEIFRNNSKYKKIILAGAAGSGKDFLRDKLVEGGFEPDVSFTTRPPRDGEIEGVTYNFISEDNFDVAEKSGLFFEHVTFNGAKYGTSLNSWEESDVFIMTPSGVKMIPDEDYEDCLIIYLDIDEDTRRERISKRSDGGFDKVNRRMEADKRDFEGFCTMADLIITDPYFIANEVIKKIITL